MSIVIDNLDRFKNCVVSIEEYLKDYTFENAKEKIMEDVNDILEEHGFKGLDVEFNEKSIIPAIVLKPKIEITYFTK